MDVGLTPGPGTGYSTHVMNFVSEGDILKVYTTGSHDLLGTLKVTSTRWINQNPNDSIPALQPESLARRVASNGIEMWEVEFDTKTSSLPARQYSNYSALVQIDRFSSFGALVQNNFFHDSYNNIARFAGSHLMYRNNTVSVLSLIHI